MKIPTIESLLENELKDLHSAETQLVKALPKIAKTATNTDLQDALIAHLEETKGHVARLEKIGQLLGTKMTGVKCKAMEGLLEEGKEVIEMEAPSHVIDVAIIAGVQRIEHYEISGYGTARALAAHLQQDDIVELLSASLEEESSADEKLTSICLESILGSINEHQDTEDLMIENSNKFMRSRR